MQTLIEHHREELVNVIQEKAEDIRALAEQLKEVTAHLEDQVLAETVLAAYHTVTAGVYAWTRQHAE